MLGDVESKDVDGIKLPEGYAWADALTATAPYAGTTAQFEIVNAQTGETSVAVVNFVEIKGVELTAEKEGGLFGEEELTLTAVPVLVPEVSINVTDSRFKYSFADTAKMKLKEAVDNNRITLARQETSREGLTNYVTTMQYTAGGRSYKVTSASYSFSTRKAAFAFSFNLTGDAKNQDGKILVEKVGDKFKLEDLKVVGLGTKDGVTVKVGDTGILKYSNKEFKAVASGTTYITLTAVADKTAQTVLMVKVKGKDFALNVSSLTIDKAKNEGTSFIVSKQGDSELETVSVSKVLKGTKERTDLKDMFEVRNVIGNVFKISVKADTDENGVETANAPKITNGSYYLVLASGDKEFEPVLVNITETRPYVTLKQTRRVNLFYKAGTTNNTGVLKATSRLASVTLKAASGSDFNLASSGSEYQLIMTNAAQKKIDSRGRLNTKMVLTASFDGYKKAYDRTVTYYVQTKTEAPSYKLELSNRTLYSKLDIVSSELRVLNRTTGEYVTDADITLASSRTSYVRANKNFTLTAEGGVYTLSTTKSGTAKISIIDPDFSKSPATRYATDREVILDAPLTIYNGKPTVTIATARLNGDAQFAASSQGTAKVTIRNSTDYTINDLQLTGNSKGAKKLLPFLSYSFEKDELGQSMIVVSFKDSEDMTVAQAISSGIIRRGTYSFTANYAVNTLTGMKSTFNIEIMTGARVSGTVKGSINLIDRAGSYATVTPHIYYLGGKATGMYFKGAENLFDVEWDSTKGVARVYAKADGSYRVNSRYRVTPVFKVSTDKGEVELTAQQPVSILVRQTRVKLTTAPVVEVKISDLDQSGMAVVNATSPKGVELAYMEQLTQKDRFNVNYDTKSGNLYVNIANVKGLKTNSTYYVRMNVVPVGNSQGATQQTYTFKVRVIR